MPIPSGMRSSASVQWYTPDALVRKIVDFLGAIDLDPCADPGRRIPAARHFTEDGPEDGLAQEWRGRVFMNPPYGREIPKWTRKALAEPVQEIIMLVPARVDTQWFRPLFSCSICFIEGRLKFLTPSGERDAAMFPSALIYCGGRHRQFAAAFANLGTVIAPDRAQKPARALISKSLFDDQEIYTEQDVDRMASKNKKAQNKCRHLFWRPCPAMPEFYEECAAGCGEKRYREGYTPKSAIPAKQPAKPRQEQEQEMALF